MNKIAVFFDADNISAAHAPWVLKKLKYYQGVSPTGEICIAKAFGDLSTRKDWLEFSKENTLQTIHVPAAGKNSSDITLTIEAMKTLELQASNHIDLFAVVSSDSDFSALALEIRARGSKVIGIGEESKTKRNKRLQKSFSEFWFIPTEQNGKVKLEPKDHNKTFFNIFAMIFNNNKDKLDSEGFLELNHLGSALKIINPEINYKDLGFDRLGDFLRNFCNDNPDLCEYKVNGTVAKFKLLSEFWTISKTQNEKVQLEQGHIETFLKIFTTIFNNKKEYIDSEGFLELPHLGSALKLINPEIDYKDFGFARLGDFLNYFCDENPDFGEYKVNGTVAQFKLKKYVS